MRIAAILAARLTDFFPDLEAAATGSASAAHVLIPSRAYTPLKSRRFVDVLRSHVRRDRGADV